MSLRPFTTTAPLPCALAAAAILGIGLSATIVRAAAATADTTIDFARDVRPLFQKHCYECHGETKQKSGLRLDVKSAAFKGGDHHGAAILPGKPGESPLLRFITSTDEDEKMPPKGEGLSTAETAIITQWIQQGAVWPDSADVVKLKDKRDHWSFHPILSFPAPRPPAEAGPTGTSKDPAPSAEPPAAPAPGIDTFIEASLQEKGLTLSPPASRAVWLRRVTFDLTGLPPTPEEIDAFQNDSRPDAFEIATDRLLASPRYGERWAQHWLDVVRYADTHGFEVNTERPNAWPYRDYVIDAFNADTPYDQFIRVQLAGDTMGQDAATGFLVTASVLLPGQIGADEPSKRLARQDALDEIVNNIGQTFLGLSIGCARCHDHKFDPVTARDYYAMQAFVAGVEYEDRDLHTPAAEAARKEAEAAKLRLAALDHELTRFTPLAKTGAGRPMINASENADRFPPVKTRRVRLTIRATNNLEPCIDELEILTPDGRNLALASAGATASASGSTAVENRHDLKFLNDGEYGNSRSWMGSEPGKGWVEIEFPVESEVDLVLWGRDRQRQFTDRLAIDYQIETADASGHWRCVADATDRTKYDPASTAPASFTITGLPPDQTAAAEKLLTEKRQLESLIRTAANTQKAFAGIFRDPDKIHLLSRGDPEQPKDEVTPAVPAALGDLVLTNTAPEAQRRQALAAWITSPANPLTARVMANRVWQGHFGGGLVRTPSDFGNNGMPPTHPALLDWLATEFMRGGWSVKHLHRLIVLSKTYRQSGPGPALRADPANTTKAAALDADSLLLWCFPTRRLEAETIRDSMLAVSGRLNLKMHGPGYDLFNQRGGLSGFNPVESFSGDGLRRMIYSHKIRRETEAVFGAFDCPDAGQSTAARRASTTPIQALNLLNSRFTLEESEAFATRIRHEAGDDLTKQITRAWQLALSRPPAADELAEAEPAVKQYGLAPLCRALFNSNEFLFPP